MIGSNLTVKETYKEVKSMVKAIENVNKSPFIEVTEILPGGKNEEEKTMVNVKHIYRIIPKNRA